MNEFQLGTSDPKHQPEVCPKPSVKLLWGEPLAFQ